MSLRLAIGITIGFGVSIGAVMVWERIVTTLCTPENVPERAHVAKRMLLIAILKYAVIGFVLWGALKFNRWVSPEGMAVGIGLPYMVIFLKALGRTLTFGSKSSGR